MLLVQAEHELDAVEVSAGVLPLGLRLALLARLLLLLDPGIVGQLVQGSLGASAQVHGGGAAAQSRTLFP